MGAVPLPRQNDFRNNVAAKLSDMASSPMKFSGHGQQAILLILKPVGILANDR